MTSSTNGAAAHSAPRIAASPNHAVGRASFGRTYAALRLLARQWWLFRRRIAFAYGASALAVLATLALPWPLKLLIDDVLTANSGGGASSTWLIAFAATFSAAQQVMVLAGSIAVLSWLASQFGASEKLLNARVREAFGVHLRDHILNHVLQLGTRTLTRERRGELVLRLVDDVDRVNRLFNKTLPLVLKHGVMTIALTTFMCSLDWRMGTIALLLLSLLALVARGHAAPLQQASAHKRQHEGGVAGLAQEIIGAVQHVQMDGSSERVRTRFREQTQHSFAAGIQETQRAVRMERTLQVLGGAAVAVVAGAGGLLVLTGDLTLGTLTVCMAYMAQLLKPVEKINELASATAQGSVRAERLFELLQEQPEIVWQPGALAAPRAPLCLRLHDVSFAYDARSTQPIGSRNRTRTNGAPSSPALLHRHLTAEFRSGQLVAVTGANGSGKSTLIKLMLRLVEPSAGALSINGIAYPDLDLRQLRALFAVSAQQHRSFAGSVRSVLTAIRAEADDATLWSALGKVQLQAFVRALPNGLDTQLTENAVDLSGGQRSRLALAAALAAERPILILDEPFASVDADSRAAILSALVAVRTQHLCIVITHERHLVRAADSHWRLQHGVLQRINAAAELSADAARTTAQQENPA